MTVNKHLQAEPHFPPQLTRKYNLFFILTLILSFKQLVIDYTCFDSFMQETIPITVHCFWMARNINVVFRLFQKAFIQCYF